MRTLYKTQSDNCCGFCRYHHKGVTPNQLRRKQCIERHCQHLQKYKQHPYWAQLEYQQEKKLESKELRKQRKAAQKAYFEYIKSTKPTTDELNAVKSNATETPRTNPDCVLVYSTDDPTIDTYIDGQRKD